MAVTGSGPLVGAATVTSASAPVAGTINVYDATSAPLAPTLPALSGISTGATLIVQKSQADATSNAVTITCTGGDTFDDATTTLVMKAAGDLRHLQCVLRSGTKYWKVIGTAATGSASGLSTTSVKTAAYSAAVSELIPVDATTAGFTVTLPTTPASGSRVSLKKIDSSINAVTVAAGGSDVFNKSGGPTTLTMVALNQAITVQYSSGVWIATTNDVPVSTLDTRYAVIGGADSLTSSVVTLPRWAAGSSLGVLKSNLVLTYFTCDKNVTVSNLTMVTGVVAAAATPTLVRFGLYSIDGSGNLTLIGSTPNDTTLFAAVTTAYTKAMSASVSLTQGTRYASGFVIVSAVAAPQLQGMSWSSSTELAIAPRLTGVSAQTDLPATLTAGSVSINNGVYYMRAS